MKLSRAMGVISVAVAVTGTALAGSAPPASSAARNIALVVNVNQQGSVTGIQPSEHLPAWERALLMEQLHQWIRNPATDKHGKPIASRFILEVEIHTDPRPNGAYGASFSYVQAMPIGFSGPVYWDRSEQTHGLTLVSALSNGTDKGSGFWSIQGEYQGPPLPANLHRNAPRVASSGHD